MAIRVSRVIAWLTVVLGAIVVVVLLGGMAALQTSPVRQWLSQQIKSAANQSLGLELNFDDLGGSVIGGLRIKNVTLRKQERLLATARELSLGYSIFALLGDELEISSAVGRDVWVDLPGVTALVDDGDDGGEFGLVIKRIRLNGGGLDAGGMMGPVLKVSGVKANCSLTIKGGRAAVNGQIDNSNWSLENISRAISLSGQAILDGDNLTLTKLRLACGGAKAQGAVAVNWSAATRIKGKLQVTDLANAGLPWPAQAPPQAGNAAIEVNGPYNSLDVKVSWPELKTKLRGHLALSDGLLAVEGIVFKAPWGGLQGGLQWRYEKGGQGLEQAEITFDKMCMPPFLSGTLPVWTQGIQLSGQALVNRQDGKLNLDLGLGNCCLASGVDLPSLKAYCRLEGEDVGLDSMAADLGWGNLTASGTFDLDRADLNVTLRTSDLGRLAHVANSAGLLKNAQYHGEASLTARISGPWRNPALQIQAQCRQLQAPNMAAELLELKADVKDIVEKPTGRFVLKASRLHSGDIDLDLAEVDYVRASKDSRLDFNFEGGRLKANGTLQHVTGKWIPENSELSALGIWNQEYGWWKQEGRARLSTNGGGFAVSGLQLIQNGQQILLDGHVDLAGPVNAQLRLQNIAVATFQSLTGGAPTRGRMTGRATLSGELAKPVAVVSGVVDEIGGPHMPDCDFRFRGRYGEDQLDVTGEIVAQGKPVMTFSTLLGLHISLRPPVIQPTEKGITAKLWADDLPLAALSGYLPWIYNLKGQLSVSVNCHGSWDAPDLKGNLAIKNASLVIPQTGQGPRDINIQLELQGRTLYIRQFRVIGSLDSMPLVLEGTVELPMAQTGGYDLRLTGPDLKISLGDLGWVRTAVNLSLTGPFDQAMLKGKVEPFKSFIRYHMLPSGDMSEVVVMEPGKEPPPIGQSKTQWRPGGWLGNLGIDASVDLNRGLRIELRDGWFVLGGAMILKKQPGKWISYGGTINLENGLILLYGRRVQLIRGVLDFGNKEEINPDMDLEAGLTLGSTKVFAAVTGTPSNPIVHLSSQPPMDQADLLSTIVFGRPASELSGDQQNYLSAQAIALLGFQGSQALRRIIGPEFAPDVITVHDSAQYGASLEAGKYIGEDLYLRYRKNLGSEGGQNVGLEYQFSRSWSVESQVGDTRDTGMDIFYSLEWGK